jgi:ATP-dependent Lon protease
MTTPSDNKLQLPVLPLRDVVVFPHMVIPLFVGRERSISALQHAMDSDKKIFLVAQKKAGDDAPSIDDVFDVGCVATILQMMKLPDGNVRLLVEGECRAKSEKFEELDSFLSADINLIGEGLVSEVEEDAMIRTTIETFETLVKLNKKVPSEILNTLTSIDDAGRLADTIIAHLPLKIEEKQKILEMGDVNERMDQLMAVMESELDLLQVEKKIRGRVKKQMEKSQREYYLNEQMKAIQKELGDVDENGNNEIDDLHLKITESGMTEDALEKATAELKKLKMMPPMSSEATVVRGYIEWLVGLPWKKKTKVRKDLAKAEEILEADHYGLEKVKDRILEYLAVQNRVNKLKGPILCLVGPPGVGKTSLARSIARSTGRKFVRMSLGGVRDEAEIRGHRRTYIGSMPGKLIQKISKAKVKNPLVLLDEIDKMAMDMRGDPASALLEVLDPEQNKAFNDHYLEVDYDLSDVMFVATSNSMNIPAPLLDRMEVIRIAGYTEDEKLNIANRYLLPKQIKENGVKKNELDIPDEAIVDLIRYYTREAGVRSLERELANLCRKAVKKILLKELKPKIQVDSELLVDLLGVKRFDFGQAAKEDQIGQVTGLAWTEVGGDLLSIETAVVKGKGKHSATGRLGDVMQESIKAAMTVVRNRAVALGIDPDFYEKNDVHVHVPEGATPKDGPSAGIAMCTALTSVLTGIPVSSQVAMTGEITLRGEVLPIGGLKEKLLAAHRGGIKTVIIPKDNEKDLAEIPDNIKADLSIHPVRWFDEVIKLALVRLPIPLESEKSTELASNKDATTTAVQAH